MFSLRAVALKMDPVRQGRRFRYSACRIVYYDSGIDQAIDFEPALRGRLPEGSSFCARRFVTAAGQVCYEVVINLSSPRRFTGDVGGMFILPGDRAAVELLALPARGEYLTEFLRQQVQELYAASDSGGGGEVFGTLHSMLGLDGDGDGDSRGRSVSRLTEEQGRDVGRVASVERSAVEVQEAIEVASRRVQRLPYSLETFEAAVELQEQKVRLSELRLARCLMIDHLRQSSTGGEGAEGEEEEDEFARETASEEEPARDQVVSVDAFLSETGRSVGNLLG